MILAMWFPKRRALDANLAAERAECSRSMNTLVRTIPGFISVKTYTAADGENIVIARFKSQESLKAWHEHPDHRAVQERGREAYFDSYRTETYEFTYAYAFDRKDGRRALTAESVAALHAGVVGGYEE